MPSSPTSRGSARGAARRSRRASREHAIISATRALFDERGRQVARIEDIARAASLNKALIYRSFSSKEEIFALAAADYLHELREWGIECEAAPDPVERLRGLLATFADFCVTYPAFLDCGLSLLARPAPELREMLSDATWFRVSRAVGRCVGGVQRAVEAASPHVAVDVEDPGFTAGRLLTQMMGSLHLARLGVSLQEPRPGAIIAVALDPQQVRDACVRDALAVVGVHEAAA